MLRQIVGGVAAGAVGTAALNSWGASGWVADIVPHVIYGLVTVIA